jgi:hypothetical protein
MTSTLKNIVSNGLIGSTVSVGYGAIPPATPLTIGKIYTTNTTAGQFLTSGSNGTSWSNSNDTVLKVTQSPPELEVKGRLVINGVDLEERLNTIEKVLSIPERDVRIEEKHPKIKKLYDEYIQALAKYRTFDTIKGDE